MPIILAIEMSQRLGTAAIHTSEGKITEGSFLPELTSDFAIFDCLSKIFEKEKIDPKSLDYIAISRGPGGFTGLRVAATFAATASVILETDLLEIPSGIIPAIKHTNKKKQLLVAAAGKRDDCWYTRCCYSNGIWMVGQEMLVNKNNLNSFLQKKDQLLLADDHLPGSHRSFFNSVGLTLGSPIYSAGALALWSVKALDAGIISPVKQKIKICYPRKPEAIRRFRGL